jgi:phenylalanyl-tRNA synthetase beta chain
MLASYKWLRELCAFDASPDEVARRFTGAGLEVEGQKHFGELPGVVIAEVRARRPHPSKDKLSLVTLFDGAAELEVVCGAPNVPAPGKRVLFARIGARLPSGLEIAERKLGGVVSRGMICSEVELDIGAEADGIVVLEDTLEVAPGTPAAQALGLDDVVFEIGLTPNRPDCLGHLGLARELSALFGAPLTPPRPSVTGRLLQVQAPPETQPVALFTGATGAPQPARAALQVSDAERCPRYAAALVDEITIGASPFWLRFRLHVLGLRAINNAVDITNLVLLEYGYPTHAFDLDLLQGARIEVRRARAGERITALDGVERALDADDLLICDAAGAVAIAGVMGGERSSIQAGTRRVLIECAYFEPRGVRRTARRLGLHTDSSHRFERGVDPGAVPAVLARVAGLLAELAGGTPAAQAFEFYPRAIEPRSIALREQRAAALLGVSLPPGKAAEVLTALGCEVAPRAGGELAVRAPTWRPDLTREEDLIEEVARIWGYDHIPTRVPDVKLSPGTPPATRFVRALRERAAAVGLTEVINLAFVSPKQLEQARVSTDALPLINPLSEERNLLRTSLLPGLLANVQRAQRHQVASCRLFELARTFTPSAEPLPEERRKLGIVLAGTRGGFIGPGEELDFFDLKGCVESILRPLARGGIETRVDPAVAQQPYLHPRRAARVHLFGAEVGVLGELHPALLDDFALLRPVLYAELDVNLLFEHSRGHLPPQVRPLPRFPASARDLALVVPEAVEAAAVAKGLREAGGALVEEVELFDLYRGEQVAPGTKSLAFRVRYRDPEATLTDARVDEAHRRVLAEAERTFKAQIRA